MKKILFAVFVLVLPIELIAQMTDTEKEAWRNSFNKPGQIQQDTATGTVPTSTKDVSQEVTIETILENVKPYTSPSQPLLENDVITYFNLQGYDTPLKLSIFKKTSEYKDYLRKFEQERKAYLDQSYYQEISCDGYYGNDLTKYNVKRRGFVCEIDNNVAETPAPYINEGLILKGFPIELTYRYTNTDPAMLDMYGKRFNKCLLLPMNEKKGLEIENTSNAKVYLVCKKLVLGVYWKKEYGDGSYEQILNPSPENSHLDKITAPACDGARILVVAGQNGRVLFDKQFNAVAPKKKISIK